MDVVVPMSKPAGLAITRHSLIILDVRVCVDLSPCSCTGVAACLARMSPFVTAGGALVQDMALTSVALFSDTASAPTMAHELLVPAESKTGSLALESMRPSLAAGVPHFSTGAWTHATASTTQTLPHPPHCSFVCV